MSNLAILGGRPAVTIPYKYVWPIITVEEVKECVDLLYKGELSYYGFEGKIKEFEESFCKYHDVKYSVSTSSGTQALHSAFFALGLGPRDEVLCPTYTFLATIMPLYQCRAVPVLCDSEPDTGNISCAEMKKHITSRTKAVVVTHMWGHPCEMDEIILFCHENGLLLIEDCSHAHGATYKGKKVGTFGDVSCFSLQAAKIVTGGTGGILLTNDQEIYERATLLGHFRVRSSECVVSNKYSKYSSTGFGMNYRMHPLAAAIANIQFQQLDNRIMARCDNLNYLSSLLEGIEGIIPPVTKSYATRGAYYGYKPHYTGQELWGVPLARYVEALRAEGVDVNIPGSKPLHLLPMFQRGERDLFSFRDKYEDISGDYRVYSKGDFPISEAFYSTSLSMPTFTGVSNGLIDQYVAAFKKVADNIAELSI
jgi:dTDP-4-amino-4,6-dideoxygalactose transaminase